MDVLVSARRLDLNDRPRLDKQTRDLDRLAQGAAAVATQVDDQQVRRPALTFEAFEHFLHVAGRALEVVFAAGGSVEIAVEGRNVEDADASLCPLQAIA